MYGRNSAAKQRQKLSIKSGPSECPTGAMVARVSANLHLLIEALHTHDLSTVDFYTWNLKAVGSSRKSCIRAYSEDCIADRLLQPRRMHITFCFLA